MRLKNGENHLTQWDRHQILVFSEYPAGTEIHMWCDFFDNALKFELDSNREVVVPDILLQTSGMLRICVYVTNKYNTSYTEVRYLIPVKARPRPEDYVYTPEETKLWEQKLDKNLGENNAGKILTVDKNGDVTAVEMPVIDGPGENDISLGLSSAAVGDIIKVKAVDDNGTPTAWESAAMPVFNANKPWELINSVTLTKDDNTSLIVFDKNSAGNSYEYDELYFCYRNGTCYNPNTLTNVAYNARLFVNYSLPRNDVWVQITNYFVSNNQSGKSAWFLPYNKEADNLTETGNSFVLHPGGASMITGYGLQPGAKIGKYTSFGIQTAETACMFGTFYLLGRNR